MTGKQKLKLIKTLDGSQSLYNEELNESYHSLNGARGESEHVFIEFGLNRIREVLEQKPIRLLEIGMGTGLNVFLSCLSRSNKRMR